MSLKNITENSIKTLVSIIVTVLTIIGCSMIIIRGDSIQDIVLSVFLIAIVCVSHWVTLQQIKIKRVGGVDMKIDTKKAGSLAVMIGVIALMGIFAVSAVYSEDTAIRLIALAVVISLATTQVNGKSIFKVSRND